MANLQANSPWKLVAAAMLLSAFFCIGIANVIKPGWFIKRSGIRKGGELLTDWNQLSFQIAGAVFAGFSAHLLYVLFRY